MAKLSLNTLGKVGVVIDSDYAHTPVGFSRTQNMSRDPLGRAESIVSRLGLTPFNVTDTAGVVLGGIGVPLRNRFTGTREFYIGRGETV